MIITTGSIIYLDYSDMLPDSLRRFINLLNDKDSDWSIHVSAFKDAVLPEIEKADLVIFKYKDANSFRRNILIKTKY